MIRTNNQSLYCPEKGLEKREEIYPAPTSEDNFKAWAAGLYAWGLNLYKQDEVLLDCWNREQAKRGR